ncbi:MAG: hypothetical protein UY10_C0013G0012 [Microgenomates group bacterium GW2011_GWA2_47_8]|nr:MAG: hypothetical protein UY10_C0013G0012 [Microgenomates group bacterium GW2011_GWA2_47_8]
MVVLIYFTTAMSDFLKKQKPLMNPHQEYYDLVVRVHPQIIAITGGDPLESNKREQAANADAQLVVIPKIPTPSTSQLAKLLGLE